MRIKLLYNHVPVIKYKSKTRLKIQNWQMILLQNRIISMQITSVNRRKATILLFIIKTNSWKWRDQSLKMNKNRVVIQFRNLIEKRRKNGNLRPNLKKKEMLKRSYKVHLRAKAKESLYQRQEIVFKGCPLQTQGVEIPLSRYHSINKMKIKKFIMYIRIT